jgi:hypothetical protein
MIPQLEFTRFKKRLSMKRLKKKTALPVIYMKVQKHFTFFYLKSMLCVKADIF